MPFVITANCNFVPGGYEPWQAAYDQLAEYVWANEPTTMTYYFGLPLQHWTNKSATSHMFAFEVYADRESLYTTHFSSPAMKEFLTKIPPTMTTGLDLSNYEDVGGFLDKFMDKRECEIMTDVRITSKPDTRDNVLSRLQKLSEELKTSGPRGVLSFSVLKGLDDNQGIRIFQRFDSWRSSGELASERTMLGFWQTSKADILSMESQTYVPNGKGWLHRGTNTAGTL